METNPVTASRNFGGAQRGVAALAIVGIAVGAACFAHAQSDYSPYRTPGPAAKLGKPQPITDAQSPVITRGLAPEASVPGQPAGWMTTPSSSTVRPLIGGSDWPQQNTRSVTSIPNTVPAKKPSFVDSTWASLKDVVVGKPTQAPTPAPRSPPGNGSYITAQNPGANPAQNTGVYAGPPAYRWYGWGTTTPGSNAHAPNGQYPRGSTNWYTQTGATPGAFPVTVPSNGARAMTSEPPAYVGGYSPPLNEPYYQSTNAAPTYYSEPPIVTGSPTPVMTFPVAAQPIPVTTFVPMPVPNPQFSAPLPMPAPWTPSQTMPVNTVPVNTVTVPSFTPIMNTMPVPPAFEAFPAPTIVPSGAISEMPPSGGVTWQSAPVTDTVAFTPSQPTTARKFSPPVPAVSRQPQPTAPTSSEWSPAKPNPEVKLPIGRSQEPSEPTVVTLPAAVRNASYGWATVTEVNHVSPSKILIRLMAASDADARAASECISRLPQLKEFTVDFEVKIGTR